MSEFGGTMLRFFRQRKGKTQALWLMTHRHPSSSHSSRSSTVRYSSVPDVRSYSQRLSLAKCYGVLDELPGRCTMYLAEWLHTYVMTATCRAVGISAAGQQVCGVPLVLGQRQPYACDSSSALNQCAVGDFLVQDQFATQQSFKAPLLTQYSTHEYQLISMGKLELWEGS